jgi:protease I
MVKKILILVGDFAEDYEVMVPYQALQICGFEVDVVCPNKKAGDTIQTAIHDFKDQYQFFVETLGHCFKLTKNFDEVKPEDYDGLYIAGGRAPEYLRYEKKILEITEFFLKNNKPLCAVCHALLILAAVPNGIKGKTVTGFYSVRAEIEAAGATYDAKNEAVTDGVLVTGQSYLSHVEMIKQFVKVMNEN